MSQVVIHEIEQTIWVYTPLGEGRAKFLVSSGAEDDYEWVCFLDNGEIWSFKNNEIVLQQSITEGRRYSPEYKEKILARLKKIGEEIYYS